jgi:hypothetical protein
MSTGQTMMTIFALILLTTVLTSFYNVAGNAGDDIARGQVDILETAVATSWAELAQGLAFDSVTDTSDIAFQNPSALTSPSLLGTESGESPDSVNQFNDFDDFNGITLTKAASTTGFTFTTRFKVSYVDTNDVNTIVNMRTFVKRMDMWTWRSIPPPQPGEHIDTLFTSIVYSYFNFN